MLFLKSLFWGTPSTVLKLAGDIALALVMRIGWKVILERLITRVLVGCLKWLATLSTNRIYKATVTEILKDFESRGLTKAVAYESRRLKRNNGGD